MELITSVTYDLYAVLVVISMVLALMFKDRRWFTYTLVIAISMLLSYLTLDLINRSDPDYVYRYVFWVLNDCINLSVVCYLWLRQRVYDSCYFTLAFAVIGMIIFNGFRYVDIHLADFESGDLIYGNVMVALNGIVVASCFMPFTTIIITLWRRYVRGFYRSSGSSFGFDACVSHNY